MRYDSNDKNDKNDKNDNEQQLCSLWTPKSFTHLAHSDTLFSSLEPRYSMGAHSPLMAGIHLHPAIL